MACVQKLLDKSQPLVILTDCEASTSKRTKKIRKRKTNNNTAEKSKAEMDGMEIPRQKENDKRSEEDSEGKYGSDSKMQEDNGDTQSKMMEPKMQRRYERPLVECHLCKKKIIHRAQHLKDMHRDAVKDKAVYNTHLSQMRMSAKAAKGKKVYVCKCKYPGCGIILSTRRMDNHLKVVHHLEPTDLDFERYSHQPKTETQGKSSYSTSDQGIFSSFEEHLRALKSSQEKNSKQHRKEVEKFTLILCQLENHREVKLKHLFTARAAVIIKVKDKIASTSSVSTAKHYLGSVLKFIKFVKFDGRSSKALKTTYISLERFYEHVCYVIKCMREEIAERLYQNQIKARENFIPEEEIKIYCEKAGKEMEKLSAMIESGKSLGNRQKLLYRDNIIHMINIGNGGRTGAVVNMTLQEVQEAKKIDDHYVIQVKRHKTIVSDGPANVVIQAGNLWKWLHIYIERLRPQKSKSNTVFVNTRGKSPNGLAQALQRTWKDVTGVKRPICNTLLRHQIASSVWKSNDHKEIALVAKHMSHKVATAEKSYVEYLQPSRSVDAFKIISKSKKRSDHPEKSAESVSNDNVQEESEQDHSDERGEVPNEEHVDDLHKGIVDGDECEADESEKKRSEECVLEKAKGDATASYGEGHNNDDNKSNESGDATLSNGGAHDDKPNESKNSNADEDGDYGKALNEQQDDDFTEVSDGCVDDEDDDNNDDDDDDDNDNDDDDDDGDDDDYDNPIPDEHKNLHSKKQSDIRKTNERQDDNLAEISDGDNDDHDDVDDDGDNHNVPDKHENSDSGECGTSRTLNEQRNEKLLDVEVNKSRRSNARGADKPLKKMKRTNLKKVKKSLSFKKMARKGNHVEDRLLVQQRQLLHDLLEWERMRQKDEMEARRREAEAARRAAKEQMDSVLQFMRDVFASQSQGLPMVHAQPTFSANQRAPHTISRPPGPITEAQNVLLDMDTGVQQQWN